MRDVRTPVRMLVYVVVLTAAFVGPGSMPASAQAQDVDGVLSRGDYSSAEEQRVRVVFDRAESTGVPGEMLIPRLAEGVAKGVPAARLIPVLDARLDSLVTARQVFEEHGVDTSLPGRRGLWNAAALLIWDDAPRDHLEAIVSAAPVDTDRLRPGFSLYASLVDWGLRRNEALAVSEATVASPLPAEDFPAVVSILTTARQERIPVTRAVDRLTSALPNASEVSDLREEVLY